MDQYPPQGQYPPPQGQYPPPQGQYPPPQGQMPPQQGQYPPPQGQMPPQQGQYPPPQGGPPGGQANLGKNSICSSEIYSLSSGYQIAANVARYMKFIIDCLFIVLVPPDALPMGMDGTYVPTDLTGLQTFEGYGQVNFQPGGFLPPPPPPPNQNKGTPIELEFSS